MINERIRGFEKLPWIAGQLKVLAWFPDSVCLDCGLDHQFLVGFCQCAGFVLLGNVLLPRFLEETFS